MSALKQLRGAAFLKNTVNLNQTRIDQADAAFDTLTSFVKNGAETKDIFKKSKPEVWSVAMWEGGAVLSGTNDGRILLWNTVDLSSTNDVLYQEDGRHDAVAGVAFVPAGGSTPTMFLSTHSHGAINLWQFDKLDGPWLLSRAGHYLQEDAADAILDHMERWAAEKL